MGARKPPEPKKGRYWHEVVFGPGHDIDRVTKSARETPDRLVLAIEKEEYEASKRPKEKAKNLLLMRADALEMLPTLRDNSIPRFTANYFLRQLNPEQRREALQGIKRTLAPRGKFVVTTAGIDVEYLGQKIRDAGFKVNVERLTEEEMRNSHSNTARTTLDLITGKNKELRPYGLVNPELERKLIRDFKRIQPKKIGGLYYDHKWIFNINKKIGKVRTLDDFLNYFWPTRLVAEK